MILSAQFIQGTCKIGYSSSWHAKNIGVKRLSSQKPNLQRVEHQNAVTEFFISYKGHFGIGMRQVGFPNYIYAHKLIRTWRAARCAESRDTVLSRGGREATGKKGKSENFGRRGGWGELN